MKMSFKLYRSFCRLALISIAWGWGCGAVRSRAAEVRFIPDVAYLAPGRTEKLDLYLPVPDPQGRLSPAVVWIHGRNSDKGEKRAHIICGMLATAGYVCVSINHGPDDAKEANIRDCKNAVRFLRVHAAEYHLDLDHIAAAGGSGGGYNALILGFTAGDLHFEPSKPYPGVSSAVCAVVDFYGPMGSRRGVRVPDCIAPGGPPVLILQGQADHTVSPENSFELARALKANGIAHQFLLLPGVDHSFRLTTTWDDKPLPIDLGPVVLDFLNRYLRPQPIKALH